MKERTWKPVSYKARIRNGWVKFKVFSLLKLREFSYNTGNKGKLYYGECVKSVMLHGSMTWTVHFSTTSKTSYFTNSHQLSCCHQ